jgi:hypothetical protein
MNKMARGFCSAMQTGVRTEGFARSPGLSKAKRPKGQKAKRPKGQKAKSNKEATKQPQLEGFRRHITVFLPPKCHEPKLLTLPKYTPQHIHSHDAVLIKKRYNYGDASMQAVGPEDN